MHPLRVSPLVIPARLDAAISSTDDLEIALSLHAMGREGRATLPNGIRAAYAAVVEARGGDAVSVAIAWLARITRHALIGCDVEAEEARAH